MEQRVDEKLTVKEVAKELKLSTGTIKGWIQRGELKAMKLGHHTVRVLREDLDKFIGNRYGAKYFMTEEDK